MSTDAPVPVPPHHGSGPAHRAGRARLRGALRPRATRGQLIAAVLCGMLGFAAAVQVRANRDSDLAGLR
jgi:hypothetical protein